MAKNLFEGEFKKQKRPDIGPLLKWPGPKVDLGAEGRTCRSEVRVRYRLFRVWGLGFGDFQRAPRRVCIINTHPVFIINPHRD